MKLPNGDQAIVPDAKLADYCLSTSHAQGRHKAQLFLATLGLTSRQAGKLKHALLNAARDGDAVATRNDDYGQRYEIRFTMSGPRSPHVVLSVWIIASDDEIPRLVTCYPV